MYIQITVDTKKYNRPPIDLRLSDQHQIKRLIEMTRQTVNIKQPPKEGYWIRIKNKNKVYAGSLTLADCGITTGDSIEIL